MPIEIALRHALEYGLVSASQEARLKKELVSLVEEVTVKFIGFSSTKSAKKGLELTLRILSLPLQIESRNAYVPDLWTNMMLVHGFKGLARICFVRFKELASLPFINQSFIENHELDRELRRESGDRSRVKAEILNCLASTSHRTDPYYWFMYELQGRREEILERRLANWLVRTYTGTSPLRWQELVGNSGYGPLGLSEVINTMLLRLVLGMTAKPYLTYREALEIQKQSLVFRRADLKRLNASYKKIVQSMPSEFRSLRMLSNWFSHHFEGKLDFFSSSLRHGAFCILHIPPTVLSRMAGNEAVKKSRKSSR